MYFCCPPTAMEELASGTDSEGNWKFPAPSDEAQLKEAAGLRWARLGRA
jgi:hypothetical protein